MPNWGWIRAPQPWWWLLNAACFHGTSIPNEESGIQKSWASKTGNPSYCFLTGALGVAFVINRFILYFGRRCRCYAILILHHIPKCSRIKKRAWRQNMISPAHPEVTQSRQPFILTLDVGTSSVRALLFDATGAAVPHIQAQHAYKLTTSNEGEVSVDADMLVETVAKSVDETLAAAGPLAAQIGAVATDTFWHSLIGVDASNHALMPLLTWEDTRPRRASAELRAQLDENTIHQRTGALLHASYWPAKLRWLATNQPDVFKHAAQWLSFGEYLHRQILGRSACSLSMASGTGLLLTRERNWDKDLLNILGVRAEQLPPLGDLRDDLQGLSP